MRNGKEVGSKPKTSKQAKKKDEQLLFEDYENVPAMAMMEQSLWQPPLTIKLNFAASSTPLPINTSNIVQNSILLNLINPNVLSLKALLSLRKKIMKETLRNLPKSAKLLFNFLMR